MNGGRRFTVQHPDYISVSPKGSKVIVYDSRDNETHLSALLVTGDHEFRQYFGQSLGGVKMILPRMLAHELTES